MIVTELRSCIHGGYQVGPRDKKGYQLFVILPTTGKGGSIDETWRRLAGRWKPARHGKLRMLQKKVPYRGTALVALTADRKRIYGVVGLPPSAAAKRLEALIGRP